MPIYKNKENNTYFFKSDYYDIYGKRHQITRTGFDTKAACKKAEAEFLSTRDQYHVIVKKDITFGKLYDEYLENQKLKNKESTAITTDNKIKNHVLPYFEKKRIDKLTVVDIENWHNHMLGLNKYSIGYLVGIHSKFSSIMQYGIKKGYILHNVVSMHGNFSNSSKNEKKPMEFFTYEEWCKFEKELPEGVYKLFFQFLYLTGARLGESQAVTWNDFNEDFSVVYMHKNVTSKTYKKGIDVTTTKNHSSTREVAIPDELSKKLKLHYEESKTKEGFNKQCFVFGGVKPVSASQLTRVKNKACKQAGVKKIRNHDLRHSAVSLLCNEGVQPIVIASRVGHSNVNTTLRVYSHMFKSAEDEAIKVLNNKLLNSKEEE